MSLKGVMVVRANDGPEWINYILKFIWIAFFIDYTSKECGKRKVCFEKYSRKRFNPCAIQIVDDIK